MEERNVQSRLDAIEMQVIRLARWLKLAIYGWLLTVFVLLLSAWTWEPKAAQESKAQKDVLRVHQLVVVDEKGRLTVPRVDTAIDCGFAANPERIYSQIEGAAVMGLSLARYGEISFKNGRVEQNNFDGYQVLRIEESPPITHVWIVQNGIDVPSSGVGEPGLPPFAPALCNAIFAATGKRIRRLPIGDQLAA